MELLQHGVLVPTCARPTFWMMLLEWHAVAIVVTILISYCIKFEALCNLQNRIVF